MKRKQLLHLVLVLGFLLGIRDGYIALWKTGHSEPLRVFPYRAVHLPAADQHALEEGIYLTDEAALDQLLEDYLS